jgi:hypothetical protein
MTNIEKYSCSTISCCKRKTSNFKSGISLVLYAQCVSRTLCNIFNSWCTVNIRLFTDRNLSWQLAMNMFHKNAYISMVIFSPRYTLLVFQNIVVAWIKMTPSSHKCPTCHFNPCIFVLIAIDLDERTVTAMSCEKLNITMVI